MDDSAGLNICAFAAGLEQADTFPCNASAAVITSMGIATGGLSLLFVWYLVHQVRKKRKQRRTKRSFLRLAEAAWRVVGLSSSTRTLLVQRSGPVLCEAVTHTPSSLSLSRLRCPPPSPSPVVVVVVVQLSKAPRGNDLMNEISDKIKSGSRAFLKTEYYYLSFYVVVVFAVLLILYTVDPPSGDRTDGIRYAGCFVVGSALSAASGWCGMSIATDANVKTTQAAKEHGLPTALRVAFTGGAVMGFTVVGLGLMGLSIMYLAVTYGYGDESLWTRLNFASDILAGFGFGASSIAIFARVAGGIYTKAADVGADLVGKVEMDIPEDDPRNPAVIADNVGDNVGDVAGMGADLFESFVRTVWQGHGLAILTIQRNPTHSLSLTHTHKHSSTFPLLSQVGSIIAAVNLAGSDSAKILLPFWVAGAGIVASIAGFFVVGTKEGATQRNLMVALHKAVIVSSVLVVGFVALIVAFTFRGRSDEGWKIFGSVVIGLVAGILIGQITEYFTSYEFWPTRSIARAGVTGPATVIIQGLGVGMISTVLPVLVLVATILGCNALAGQYGVAMSAVGMLSTLGVTLATDAYGPVADNAGGIAEMAELDHSVRATTDALDALGNTTAATGKGFAIGSAVLTALSLLAAFTETAFSQVSDEEISIKQVGIGEPIVLSGILIGAMLPFLFASLSMLSVQKVRRGDPDENQCIDSASAMDISPHLFLSPT